MTEHRKNVSPHFRDVLLWLVSCGISSLVKLKNAFSYDILVTSKGVAEHFHDDIPNDFKITTVSAEVTMIPQTWGTLTDEQDIKSMNKILDLLDEDDDVQEVYHNWDE